MTDFQYRYLATVQSVADVYDADTVTFDVDLGFRVRQKIRARLFGIDAWEVRGPEKALGKVARDRLRALIIGQTVEIETFRDKTGKFGRWLCTIWLHKDGERINVNELLVSEGHAEVNFYGTRP